MTDNFEFFELENACECAIKSFLEAHEDVGAVDLSQLTAAITASRASPPSVRLNELETIYDRLTGVLGSLVLRRMTLINLMDLVWELKADAERRSVPSEQIALDNWRAARDNLAAA